jgi:WD40 repeat protein
MIMSAASEACHRCGSPLGRFAPGRLCARCLLEAALSDSALEDAARDRSAESPEPKPHLGRFGRYELLEEIAHGGMGVVYRARDTALNRLVALKLILAGQFASEREVKRFRAEAEAAARLDHPNIVPIYEVGDQEGRPFFSMKFMEGGTLTAQLAARTTPLDPRAAATLLVKIARAVHHAHQRAILHRDIKPGNILLDARGEPHVSDFGLAKLLDSADGLTLSGAMLGSPNYMSPEQASGPSDGLTTASDTYSLGALLYQLLTGHPPFEGATPMATVKRVLEEEPRKPSGLNPLIDRDLETICLKCLEKDLQLRYASADGLAEELERWLRHEPILARASSLWVRVGKWTRRQPKVALLTLISVLAVLALVTGQTIMSFRVHRANTETRTTNARLRASLYELRWRQADEASRTEDRAEAIARFSQFLRENPNDRAAAARLLSLLSAMNFPIPVLPPLVHEAPVVTLSFNRTGDRLATATTAGMATLWNVASGKVEFQLPHPAPLKACQLLGDNDTRLFTISTEPKARLWGLESRRMLAEFDLGGLDPAYVPWVISFTPDRGQVAFRLRTNVVAVVTAASGAVEGSPLSLPGPIAAFALSPDGRKIVTSSGGQAQLWDVATGQPLFAPQRLAASFAKFSFSSNSRWLAALAERNVWVLDTVTGARERELALDAGDVAILAEPPRLVGVPINPASPLRLIDFRTGQDIGSPFDLPGFHIQHQAGLDMATFSTRNIEGDWPPRVQLVDPRTGRTQAEPFIHQGAISTASLASDGKIVATGSQDRTVRLWSTEMERLSPLTLRAGRPVWESKWDPFGARVLSTGLSEKGAKLVVWDARNGQPLMPAREIDTPVYFANWSPDGRRFITAGGPTARIWDAQSLQPLSPPLRHDNGTTHCAFSPDGKVAATCANDETLRLWDARDGRSLGAPLRHSGIPLKITFSSDGSRLATACLDGTILIWSLPDAKLALGPLQHRGICWIAAFSPDDRLLVSASSDGTAQLWDATTGRQVHPPFQHEGPVLWASFSHDGRAVATSTEAGIGRVWDTATGDPVSEAMRHPGKIWFVKWSPDGRFLATTCEDGSARVWDAHSGHLIAEPFAHQGEVRRAEFSPDGRRLLTCSFDHTASIWELDFLRPALPVPAWLPELAEALAGKRIGPKEAPVAVPADSFHRVKERIAQLGQPDDYYRRWAKWMLEERRHPPVKPFVP